MTREQLERALVNADAAGDTEAVKVLAAALRDAIDYDPAAGMSPLQASAAAIPATLGAMARGAHGFSADVAEAAGLITPEKRGEIRAGHDAVRARDKPLLDTFGGKVGQFTAGLIPTLPIVTATARGAGALGLGMGALEEAKDGGERAQNMLATGAASMAGQGAGNLLFGWLGHAPPTAAIRESAREALRKGYDLLPGQATGGKWLLALEGALAHLPGSGGKIAERVAGQRKKFTAEALRTAGEVGDEVAEGGAARVVTGAGKRVADAAKGTQMQGDNQLFADIRAVQDKYWKKLPVDQRTTIQAHVDDIQENGGYFTGEQYQAWRADLRELAENTKDPSTRHALNGLKKALDSAFNRQAAPDAVSRMHQARGDLRNAKTLEPLLREAEVKGGNVSPLKVANRAAVERNTTGEMGSLARTGQAIGHEYPNSGTPTRTLWTAALTGGLGGGAVGGGWEGAGTGAGAALAASLLAPRAAASLYMQPGVRQALMKLPHRKNAHEELAEVLRLLSRSSALGAVQAE